jgi:hypothetical protein
MPATKRKLLETQLQRRVHARRSSSEESEDVTKESASPTIAYSEAKNAPEEEEDISEGSDVDVMV